MRELTLRLTIGLIGAFALAALFSVIGLWVMANESVQRFDLAIIDTLQGWETPALTAWMKSFTLLGEAKTMVLVSLIVTPFFYFSLRWRPQAFLFAFVIAGTGLINYLLKLLFQRPRPEFYRLVDIGGYSFPSGHTMIAFSFFMILLYIVWRSIRTQSSKWLLFILALFFVSNIGLSRIYLGVHYPSDVLGGILASACYVLLSITIYSYFQRKKKLPFLRDKA